MEQARLDELIEKYAAGTITPAEERELLEWYRAADIGAVEWPAESLEEREHLQQRMLLRLEQSMKDSTAAPSTGAIIPLPRFYQRPWFRVAAALILVFSAWSAWQYLRPHDPEFITLSNPSGKIRQMTLPDSSRVWLNAATTLRYAAAFNSSRELFLEGEAYFDVTEDKAHPFTVHAGALTTTVLGTRFDISSFATERHNSITVLSGKVQVAREGKVLDQLTAARQLQWDNKDQTAQTLTVDTTQSLGWQRGKLEFHGQPLEEAASILGRWYNVRFEFSNPALRSCRYDMSFENNMPLRDVLEVISQVNDMHYTINFKEHLVTLSGKGCQ